MIKQTFVHVAETPGRINLNENERKQMIYSSAFGVALHYHFQNAGVWLLLSKFSIGSPVAVAARLSRFRWRGRSAIVSFLLTKASGSFLLFFALRHHLQSLDVSLADVPSYETYFHTSVFFFSNKHFCSQLRHFRQRDVTFKVSMSRLQIYYHSKPISTHQRFSLATNTSPLLPQRTSLALNRCRSVPKLLFPLCRSSAFSVELYHHFQNAGVLLSASRCRGFPLTVPSLSQRDCLVFADEVAARDRLVFADEGI
jgi:hypothetical protein